MATTSAPDPFHAPPGRLESEAARARAAELFARHGRTVQGLCRGLLRDRSEAEDAAQQTFLSAYRALLGGTEPRESAAWLAAIARNECLARIRARMREPLPVEELETAAVGADPLAEALRRADISALWAAISELPRQQRDAILLREFGGLSYEELAVALGVSAPAVESLLFRARTRVRGQLREALASIGGAGWLSAAQEALARVLSLGGAAKIGSVPVVAKAVTATVGIAVVAGGAAVVGERHSGLVHHRKHTVVVTVPASTPPPQRIVEAVVPVAVSTPQPAPPSGSSAPPAAVPVRTRESAAPADEIGAGAGQGQDGQDGQDEHQGRRAGGHAGHGSNGQHRASSGDGQAATTTAPVAFRDQSGDEHQRPESSGDGRQGDNHGDSTPQDGHGGGDQVSSMVTPVVEAVPHADGTGTPLDG